MCTSPFPATRRASPVLFICFNFLEATGSISFASPSPLLFFFSLFAFLPSSCVPLFSVTASAAAAAAATARPPSWELREMYHGGFQHCGCCWVYIPILPLPCLPPSSPLRLLFSILPRQPDRPHRALSLAFLSLPFRLSLPHDALSRAATPPPRSKGLNRPVQFPTSSASSPRSRPSRRRDIARHTFISERSRYRGKSFFSPSLSPRLPLFRHESQINSPY